MKKLGLIVFLVFCVSAISCAQAGGTFTLTGIPSRFNGKYVHLFIYDDDLLLGGTSINMETEVVTFPRISDGMVSIPMWIFNERTETVSRFTGDRTADLEIEIGNTPTSRDFDELAGIVFKGVVFRRGSVTKSWSEGEFFE